MGNILAEKLRAEEEAKWLKKNAQEAFRIGKAGGISKREKQIDAEALADREKRLGLVEVETYDAFLERIQAAEAAKREREKPGMPKVPLKAWEDDFPVRRKLKKAQIAPESDDETENSDVTDLSEFAELEEEGGLEQRKAGALPLQNGAINGALPPLLDESGQLVVAEGGDLSQHQSASSDQETEVARRAREAITVGDMVNAWFHDEEAWYPALVEAVHEGDDGELEYDVRYEGYSGDDGMEYGKPASEIEALSVVEDHDVTTEEAEEGLSPASKVGEIDGTGHSPSPGEIREAGDVDDDREGRRGKPNGLASPVEADPPQSRVEIDSPRMDEELEENEEDSLESAKADTVHASSPGPQLSAKEKKLREKEERRQAKEDKAKADKEAKERAKREKEEKAQLAKDQKGKKKKEKEDAKAQKERQKREKEDKARLAKTEKVRKKKEQEDAKLQKKNEKEEKARLAKEAKEAKKGNKKKKAEESESDSGDEDDHEEDSSAEEESHSSGESHDEGSGSEGDED
mmetsp:Transcript_65571/g.147965  ORF Transcript_65571/g.147965 Transcript_65571/m.147965 type:complete len:519 (-) Transcript_65571:436-1992(-)